MLSENVQTLQTTIASLGYAAKALAIVEAAQVQRISHADAIVLTDEFVIDGIEYSSVDASAVASEAILIKDHPGAPGAATGVVATSLEQAQHYAACGENFILYVPTTDQTYVACIEGQHCVGVITETGSASTHTTVITGRAGKPAVIGTGIINLEDGTSVTIDGTQGMVLNGAFPLTAADKNNTDLIQIAAWAKALEDRADIGARRMGVKVNSYKADEIARAIANGAEGVGIVQTEYMFAGDNLPLMQEILAYQPDEEYLQKVSNFCEEQTPENFEAVLQAQRTAHYPYQQALDLLFERQKAAFKDILIAAKGFPVAVRLLDAPYNEFEPSAAQADYFKEKIGLSAEAFEEWRKTFRESNPIMGFRGAQFGIARPEVYRTQAKALLTAMQEIQQEGHSLPDVDFMQALVAVPVQVKLLQAFMEDEARVMSNIVPFRHSMMMETPNACLQSDAFAALTDDFSVGSNDLTGFTMGISREGGLEEFAEWFSTLHEGVGKLLKDAITQARAVNPNAHFKICGEHAADKRSIEMFQEMGVDTLSVSAQKVRRTIILSAQAFLEKCNQIDRQNTHGQLAERTR